MRHKGNIWYKCPENHTIIFPAVVHTFFLSLNIVENTVENFPFMICLFREIFKRKTLPILTLEENGSVLVSKAAHHIP